MKEPRHLLGIKSCTILPTFAHQWPLLVAFFLSASSVCWLGLHRTLDPNHTLRQEPCPVARKVLLAAGVSLNHRLFEKLPGICRKDISYVFSLSAPFNQLVPAPCL